MNASPALTPPLGSPKSGTISSRKPSEGSAVPPSWRVGQVVCTLVVLAACYFFSFIEIHSTRPPAIQLPDEFGFLVLLAGIWLTTPVTATIALSTLQEALRRRWVAGLLIFAAILIMLSTTYGGIQPGEEIHVLQDAGTGFIVGMTNLIAVFLGVALIPPEIDRRIIFTILSKPVTRAEFLLGKFLGLCVTLLFCLVLLGAFFLATIAVFSVRLDGWNGAWHPTNTTGHPALGFTLVNLLNGLVLQYGQLVVLSALALMLSLFVTALTAITFCFLAYFGGQMSSYWGQMGAGSDTPKAHGVTGAMQNVVKFVYYMLPRLDHFDARQMLVTDTAVTYTVVWKAWSSGLVYVAVLMVIGYLVFSDREF